MTMRWRTSLHRVDAGDGTASDLWLFDAGDSARPGLYWLPAMGVSARHYRPLAQALAAAGVSVALHEWRGHGSSNVRAGRGRDWSYRHLLEDDIGRGLASARLHGGRERWLLGGHSLGGQLAVMRAALAGDAAGLVLVASGVPHWRRFPSRWRAGLATAYTLAPLLAHAVGHFPGYRLGFAGREARGVIADWARSGRSGRYRPQGIEMPLEARMAALQLPVLAVRMVDDRFGPAPSLHGLLGKLPRTRVTLHALDASTLDAPADHFAWMRRPQVVAETVAAWVAGHGGR